MVKLSFLRKKNIIFAQIKSHYQEYALLFIQHIYYNETVLQIVARNLDTIDNSTTKGMKFMSELVTHTFAPVFNDQSRILILGTIPSPKSRAQGFYYGHPRNRFWRILAAVLQTEVPNSPKERKEFALKHRIALWDVLQQCKIKNAADSSIRHGKPNDLTSIFKTAPLQAVFTTGTTAFRLYKQYYGDTPFSPRLLPSPSPANARQSLDALVKAYRAILPFLN